ncbi:uncharacterized protein [Anabrus simplex]|uniref:uncharacterized protein n=1 Tax=Anabrus simplex TaxID=316456 RepID=UPI0035A347BF
MKTLRLPLAVCYVLTFCSFAANIADASDSYRLPLEVLPYSYSIQLVPYLDEGDSTRQFTFDGNVSIIVQAQRSTSSITLHAADMELHGLPTIIEVGSGRVFRVSNVTRDLTKDFLVIHLAESLSQGRTYRVDIDYTGNLNDNLDGFYRSSYEVNGTKRWLATTQFEATSARYAFPCFDEPALKASFKISIARLPGMNAISNMPLEKTVGPDATLNGRYWDIFQNTVNMSTYLVAFVVSDFKALQEGTYRVWSKPSYVEYGSLALEVSPTIIKVMENLTGIPYHLPKMDQVAVPDFAAGAMENWGLVTYRENMLLLTTDTESRRVSIVTTIAHEFAHQWFGDLVTLNWWKFTWLNEGFANFFETYVPDMLFPEWLLGRQFSSNKFSLMESDSDSRSVPMTRDVQTPLEISGTFDTISYTKGGLILDMFKQTLGSSTFFKGLNRYLEARAYSDATADDLSAGLQQAVDEDGALPNGPAVKDFVNSWTVQAGYPVVTVTRDYTTGTAVIQQAPFVLDDSFEESERQWYVPVSYTTSQELEFSNTKPNVWLIPGNNTTLQGLPGDDQWIILNKQAAGYFRVNYDKQNWKLLEEQLNSEDVKIPLLNRLQITNDIQNLMAAGLVDVETAMGITEYLKRETDPLAWKVAFIGLEDLYNKISGSPYLPALKAFYLRLIDKFYNTVGFTQQPGESHLMTLIRPKLLHWACRLGHDGCVHAAARTVGMMRRANHEMSIDEELRDTLYCAGVRNDGESTWNWVWSLYQNSDNVKERQKLLRALGCTIDTKLISRLLHLSIEEKSGLRPEDRLNVFSAACNGQDASSCDQTLKFVAARIHYLANQFGEYESVATVLHRIASKLKTQEQLNFLRHIIMKNKDHLSVADAITTSALDLAKRNVEWLKGKGAGIINWLAKQESASARRIRAKCEEVITETQFGFRNGLGTRDALFCIQNIGLDDRDIRIIANLYWGQKAAVKIEETLSEEIDIRRGIRQGCVLSPLLYNIYSEAILAEAVEEPSTIVIIINGERLNNVRYADDTVLLADNVEDLQLFLDKVNTACNNRGLKINIKKTQFMVISKRQDVHVQLTLDNEPIARVHQYKYLGCYLNQKWDCSQEIRVRIEHARSIFMQMKKLLNNRDLQLNLRLRLVRAYVFTTLLYGMEGWTLTQALCKRLEAFEMWMKMVPFYCLRAAYYVLVVFCSIAITIENNGIYRLPLEVKPTSYTIHLIPYLDEEDSQRAFTFDGHVSILVKAEHPEKTITLHARDIELYTAPNLTEVNSELSVPVVGTGIDRLRDFLVLGLAKSLIVGSMYRLNISYKGQLSDIPTGFYRSSYLVNGQKRWLATTHFEPISARMAFPCFDEPALKATFNITIARLPEMHAISNMPLEKTVGPISALKGRYWDIFHTSVNMSTYLVAFVVSDFQSLEDGWFKVWSKPSTLESGEFALSISPSLLRIMELITGIKYQLSKMDQVAIPNMFNTAMENWGLILYNEDDLLLEESTPSEQQMVARTIVHEFAHQWFGNLVTPTWWSDAWLNEGFASFFEFYAADKFITLLSKSWADAKQETIADSFHKAGYLKGDLGGSEHDEGEVTPIREEWVEYQQLLNCEVDFEAYINVDSDVIVPEPPTDTLLPSKKKIPNKKSGSILKMLTYALTPTTFFKGLHNYLQNRNKVNKLKSGMSYDDEYRPSFIWYNRLIMPRSRKSNLDMSELSEDGSTEPTVMGRFNLDISPAHGSKWYIPITYTTSQQLQFNDTKPVVWLSPDDNMTLLTHPGEDDWVIYNIKAKGYYRVNYDQRNWNLLQDALLKHDLKKIHPVNRGALLDDAAYLFSVGLLKVDFVMRLFSYLERETDGIPWLVALRILEMIYNKIGGSSYFSAFQSPLSDKLSSCNIPFCPADELPGFDCDVVEEMVEDATGEVDEEEEEVVEVFVETEESPFEHPFHYIHKNSPFPVAPKNSFLIIPLTNPGPIPLTRKSVIEAIEPVLSKHIATIEETHNNHLILTPLYNKSIPIILRKLQHADIPTPMLINPVSNTCQPATIDRSTQAPFTKPKLTQTDSISCQPQTIQTDPVPLQTQEAQTDVSTPSPETIPTSTPDPSSIPIPNLTSSATQTRRRRRRRRKRRSSAPQTSSSTEPAPPPQPSPPPHPSLVIQCYNCLQLHHTAATCTNSTRCNRCGGDHHHTVCEVPRTQARCANCEGNHAASFPGCPFMKKAIRSHYKNARHLRKPSPPPPHFNSFTPHLSQPSNSNPALLYLLLNLLSSQLSHLPAMPPRQLIAFALRLLSPYYERVGFEYHEEEDHLRSIVRPELLFWACLLGHMPCMRASYGLLTMANTSKGNSMDTDFQTVTFCAAVRYGGSPSWDLRKPTKDVLETLQGIGRALDLQIEEHMIDACHRLPRLPGQSHSGIIVKFVRSSDKENFMQRRRVKYNLSTRHLGLPDDNIIYMNESLAPEKRKLLALTRRFKTEHNYRFLNLVLTEDSGLKPDDRLVVFSAACNGRDPGSCLHTLEFLASYVHKLWHAATQFEPLGARRAFPCFDEPALKATFSIRIARLSNMSSVSNMPLQTTVGPDPALNGRYWDIYQPSVIMSTYLVAFMVSDFKVLESGMFRFWSKPSIVEQGNFTLNISPESLKIMEEFTGIPYNLPKLDHVVIPTYSGAMENWGMIIYGEDVIVNVLGVSLGAQSAFVIAHEIAHQWFGNLVTFNWWTYTWLTEGFADFFEYFILEKIYPDTANMHTERSQRLAMSVDSTGFSHPLSADVETPEEIDLKFGHISYKKGSSVLKMLSHVLTFETFHKGLKLYLQSKLYSNVVADDLFAALQKAVDEDGVLTEGLTVKTIMDTWTLQSGYPVITVTRNYTTGTATVHQAQFLLDVNERSSNRSWFVPLAYTSGKDLAFNITKPSLWLAPHKNITIQNLPGQDQWIIFNIQAMGFFRVNYDPQNWKLLIEQLHKNTSKIHPLNRMQLVEDIQQFVRAGLMDSTTALDLVSYMKMEIDPSPWMAAFRGLQELFDKIGGSPFFAALQSFYLNMMDGIYEAVGFEYRRTDNYMVSRLRSKVLHWACLLGHKKCIKASAATVVRMRSSSTESVDEEVRETMYCAAVRHGGETSWKLMWNVYKNADNVQERQDALRALGCTSNVHLLKRLLTLSVTEDSGLKPEDRMNVFSAACNGRDLVSCDTTLKFIKAHFHQLGNEFGEYQTISSILVRVASRLKTKEQVDMLRLIINKNKEYMAMDEHLLSSALKMAQENVDWFKTKGAPVVSWLSRHQST